MIPYEETAQKLNTLPALLLPWYREQKRDLPWRRDRDPYHVWLSEIMLQQTRVEAVRGYYQRFLAALPSVAALAEAEERELMKLWEGLGYYSRARNLQKAARMIQNDLGGAFPRTYEGILALPGVGPYTAGAVASICFELPTPAVDGNVLRFLSRWLADPTPVDLTSTKEAYGCGLARVYPPGECGAFTQALMELGATVCTPRSPRCALCPAAALCAARAQGRVEAFPVRLPKREKRLEEWTVFLFHREGRLAIQRREAPGLLSGLWQLPAVAGTRTPSEALAQATAWGLAPLDLCSQVRRSHVFTHIRWEMVGYHIRCGAGGEGFVWASREDLRDTYALPTAFRIFLEETEGLL